MTKHRTNFILLTISLFIFILALSLTIIYSLYGFSIILLLLVMGNVWIIYQSQLKVVREIQKVIGYIQFNDLSLNILNENGSAFQKTLSKAMQEALTAFQGRLFQMESEQQYYHALLSTIDSGLLVINEFGDIEWINRAALDEFGRPEPHHVNDLQTLHETFPELLMNLSPQEIKVFSFQKQGQTHQLAITGMSLYVKGKKLKLISTKNIHTVLMEHEVESWRKLIRVLTHEINNSFAPIISLSETLSERTEISESNYTLMLEAMKTIHRRSRNLLDFTESYRKLAKIPVPVKKIIGMDPLLQSLQQLFAAEGIRFEYSVVPSDLELTADRNLLEQMLINLIRNAQEACKDVAMPNIQVDVCQENSFQALIKISDNGKGIDHEILDEIFVPFFTTKVGGSGVGLSICRQIAGLHGGYISVKSEMGKGSFFEVRINV